MALYKVVSVEGGGELVSVSRAVDSFPLTSSVDGFLELVIESANQLNLVITTRFSTIKTTYLDKWLDFQDLSVPVLLDFFSAFDSYVRELSGVLSEYQPQLECIQKDIYGISIETKALGEELTADFAG